MFAYLSTVVYGLVLNATAVAKHDDTATPFLRFADRTQHVEVENTRGLLDLDKPFTIELWCRWDTDILDKPQHLAGDEAWPGMSANVPVVAESGWVIRTSPVKDADRQFVEFNVAATVKGARGWLTVRSTEQRVMPGQWQHIAVCRSRTELRVFWNGKPSGRRQLGGVTLHSSPSNVFVGVRRDAWKDREFVGDVKGFRVSSTSRYFEPFKPEARMADDKDALLLFDMSAVENDRIPDPRGQKRDGTIVGAKLIKPKD